MDYWYILVFVYITVCFIVTVRMNFLWFHVFVQVSFNTLRPRQNGRHFPDDIFKCIFFNENICNFIKISLKFVPKDPINNIPSLVQIMAWCRPGNKPLSEPMMVSLLMHICVTQPQWVNTLLSCGTFMCQWTGSSLVRVITCCLLGTKPLSLT